MTLPAQTSRVILVLSEAEASALVQVTEGFHSHLKQDNPLESACIKIDEQMSQQNGKRDWVIDDAVDVLWDLDPELLQRCARRPDPDEDALREVAKKLTDHALGNYDAS